MLQEACSLTSDPSTLRRVVFAATTLSKDTPRYWELVAGFGFKFSHNVSIEKIRLYVENLSSIDKDAFSNDKVLMKELMGSSGFQGHPIGIVLISPNTKCRICGGNLLVRQDRPSFPVLYSDDTGTVSGTHFRKYCSNSSKDCSFVQHYGCYTIGDPSTVLYDEDCLDLPYFMSTSMTVFATAMLTKLSAEILIGQMSYKQRADIFNYTHGYDMAMKRNASFSYKELETNCR